MRILFELAGDHPELPYAELDLVGTILEREKQVAVVECSRPDEIPRLALSHTALEYLGSCGADAASFSALLKDLAIVAERSFAGRVKKIHGSTMDATQMELERTIGALIRGRINLQNPEEEYRVVISGDTCYFGRVIWRNVPGDYAGRRPGNRPFFHPGVMMPRMVRALLNISCVFRGQLMLDPFCGTGGMVMEAEMLGICAVGSDFNPLMVRGSRLNAPSGHLLLADSRMLPYRDASFDAVVTDLPYGQSVSIRARSLEMLYEEALAEIARVLRHGRRAVLVTHRDQSRLAAEFMRIESRFSQRVHRSLTRYILVLRR